MFSILRWFVSLNKRLSAWFDRTLLPRYTVDGVTHYTDRFLPRFVLPNLTVYDVGGGRNPLVAQEDKERLHLRYVGIDISEEELRRAPERLYDRTYVGDISTFQGERDADLVICRAVLEHVRDVREAFRGLCSVLKPGGRLVLYVPCRNALFARVNRLLGRRVGRWLLFAIHSHARDRQGFPSYYDRCTPGQFRRIAHENGLHVEELQCYDYSFYFSFLFPLHVLHRLLSIGLHKLCAEDYCEGFSLCLRMRT